jgi:phosphocarrier protein HPr
MIKKAYTILAPEGMHARPATAMVKLARQFKAEIFLKSGEQRSRLNSLIGVLSMGIKGGATIELEIEGVDEGDAAAAFDVFFANHLKDW